MFNLCFFACLRSVYHLTHNDIPHTWYGVHKSLLVIIPFMHVYHCGLIGMIVWFGFISSYYYIVIVMRYGIGGGINGLTKKHILVC